MSMPISFPFYGPIGVGPYNVSLAFPGKNSDISKSIGLTSSTMFLVPNTDFITKFIEGNLGIAESAIKDTTFKNLNKKDLDKNTINTYTKISNIDLGDIEKFNINGKYKIPKSNIPIPDINPFKDFEKTIFKSLFETQKPYIEVAKILVNVLVKAEDVVARVMPLLSISPLTTKSKKPGINGGNGDNPRALGFKSSDIPTIESKLKELDKLSKKGIGNTNSDNKNANLSEGYKIISTKYSTGYYDPSVKYTYSYNIINGEKDNNSDLKIDDSIDPSMKYKPKYLIFGIFNSEGVPYNPNDNRMSWVKNTNKWRFTNGEYSWDSLSEPTYTWTNGLLTQNSKKSPGGKWSIKKYKKGDKNILTNQDAIEGDPIISAIDNSDNSIYTTYFNDLIKYNINKSEDLTPSEKIEYSNLIKSSLNIDSHVENLINYGQLSNAFYEEKIPDTFKKVLKPKLMSIKESLKDDKLNNYNKSIGREQGIIWIDPETDYNLKLIKVSAQDIINGDPKNTELLKDKSFSEGFYGHSNKDSKQNLGNINRNKISSDDTEYFFILEGILNDESDTKSNSNSKQSDDSKWYKLPHAIGCIKVFISLLIDIFSKLIPNINKLLTLFKNPAKFVTDIIGEKLGESFDHLNKSSFDEYKKNINIKPPSLDTISNGVRNIESLKEYQKQYTGFVNDKIDYFEETNWKNLVHVDQKAKLNTVIDGDALIPLNMFGKDVSFGMQLKMSNIDDNKSPIKLIFNTNKKSKTSDVKLASDLKTDNSTISNNKGLTDDLNSLKNVNTNYIVKDIKYSTGVYMKDVQYKYFYVTDDINNTLKEIENLENDGDYNAANEKLNEALRKNPDSDALKNKKKSLKDILSLIKTNPLFKMLLGITVIPIKLISGIVMKIMEFFKSLKNPTTLPTKLMEFLSFKWMFDFFKPVNMMKTIGITFNPGKLKEWKDMLNKTGVDKISDDTEFDLNEFLSIDFTTPLPTYTARDLRKYPNLPKKLAFPILCLIEKLVNGIIDFLWSLLGLEALTKAPHITLCKDNDIVDSIPSSDVNDILNSGQKPLNDSGLTYDITLPNGDVVKGLDQEALDQYRKDHDDIDYSLNF